MSLAREGIRDVNARRRVLALAAALTIEVPGSFSVLDLTSETTAVNSIAKLGLTAADVDTLVPQAKQFQQLHAALAVDAKGTAAKSEGFPDNIGAYCIVSGTDLAGSSAVPTIKKQLTTQFDGLQLSNAAMDDTTIGGVPGLEATYLLNSSAGTLAAGQLEVAPKPQELCFVDLTTSLGTFSESILSTAAQTARFT